LVNIEAFSQTYLVCGLTPAQVAKVAELATVERHCAQEVLIDKSTQSGSLFVILSGRVNVLTNDGEKLAEVGPGSVLGEIELIDAGPKTANAVCVGLVEIASIPVPALRTLMRSDYELGFKILANLARVLCGRLRKADQMLDTLLEESSGGAWGNAL
jgi:CRP-like cAMP-binding protein